MRKSLTLMLSLMLCALVLAGCAGNSNPLTGAEATDVPGLNMRLHPARANEAGADAFEATLYFRYQDEPMLAPESRVINVRRDETAEIAIVKALLDGPSAGRSDLRRLFPEELTVESAVARESILFITFGGALKNTGNVPEGWQNDSSWQIEAPLRRRLAIQSVVNAITESFSYAGVQILMHEAGATRTNLRLENSFFLDGREGPSDALTRDESCILTPKNALNTLLAAWSEKDAKRLTMYLADASDGTPKPAYAQQLQALQAGATLIDFTTGEGSISHGGSRAVVATDFRLRLPSGETVAYRDYPMRLTAKGGVWQMEYDEWLKLLI